MPSVTLKNNTTQEETQVLTVGTGASEVGAEPYKEFIFDVSAAANNGVGLTIDNPYVAGTNGETRLMLQDVAGEVSANDGTVNQCYIMLPYKNHFGDARDFILDDTKYFIDTSVTSAVCVFLDPRCSFRKESCRTIGQFYNPDIDALADVVGHTWDNHTHLQYEAYPVNDKWCVFGDGLVMKNGVSTQSLDGWGNDAEPDTDGFLKRYTHNGAEMGYHLDAAQYSAVTGYFGTPVDATGTGSLSLSSAPPLENFALHCLGDTGEVVLPPTPADGDTYRFVQTGLTVDMVVQGNGNNIMVNDTVVASFALPTTDRDYFELTYVASSSRWMLHSQNFLNYMAGLLPWSKVDKAGVRPDSASFTSNGQTLTLAPDFQSAYTIYGYDCHEFTGCALQLSIAGVASGIPFVIHSGNGQFGNTWDLLNAAGNVIARMRDQDWVMVTFEGGTLADFILVAASRPELMGAVTPTSEDTLTYKTLNDDTNYIDANALHERVFNNSGGALAIGQAVINRQWDGGNNAPEVELAQADAVGNCPCHGLVETSTADNAVGSVRTSGHLHMDTSAWSDGDDLWLSPTVAGGLTNVEPSTVGQYRQFIGTVLRQATGLDGVVNVQLGDATLVSQPMVGAMIAFMTQPSAQTAMVLIGLNIPQDSTKKYLWRVTAVPSTSGFSFLQITQNGDGTGRTVETGVAATAAFSHTNNGSGTYAFLGTGGGVSASGASFDVFMKWSGFAWVTRCLFYSNGTDGYSEAMSFKQGVGTITSLGIAYLNPTIGTASHMELYEYFGDEI